MADRSMLVRDVMTPDPIVISPDARVEQAHALMKEGGFRHLPVLLDGHLVGVISTADIGRLGATIAELMARPVADLMNPDPPTVTPEQPIEAAAGQMGVRKVNCLPVVAQGRVVGIITTYDLLDALALYFAPKSVGTP
jgi:acetoin utilization protein AcuB